MGKGGGRPRDEQVWKHFTELEGGRVKCNYCKHSFAAGGGSSRMKAHIHKLKRQGVRPCSAIIPPSNNEANDQERIQVASSFVSNSENEDLQVLKYVFQHLRPGDRIFQSSRLHLTQAEFTSLIKPKTYLDSWVIDTFAEILTHIERNKKTEPSNWYLPVTFSTAALGSDEDNFKRLVRALRLRENYMSEDLNSFDKMFIPVHIQAKPNGGHFYLYIIHLKSEEIEICDPLPNTSLADHHETTEKLLLAMEKLFKEVIFTKFRLKMPDYVLLQPNGFDCGLFVINFMEQADNYVNRNPKFQYDSKKEREDLALKLLKSDLNQEKQNLYKEARRCCAQVEKKDGNKRLRVDTSDDERGNRHDDLQKGSSKRYLLPTTDLGEEFQTYTAQIWNWIMEDDVSAIGVWGMGGSGKTALATYIRNKILEDEASRDMTVIWVTVSQNSISQLQKVIARSIELDISDEFEEKIIAEKLLQAFKKIKECVIILDDVWDYLFLKDVGFPMPNNRIKLILTTRMWEVCQGMDCEKNIIKVKPLNRRDSWALFKNFIGLNVEEARMNDIVYGMEKVCGGLPLAIVRIATSMKGKYQASEWRRMLECLENLGSGQYEIDKWVLPVLRSSYDFLNNKLQRFFLYCALSTNGQFDDNDADRLRRRFAYESIDETQKLRVQYNECYNMLDKLQNHGMLELDDIYNKWRIHKFFRVLAIGIAEGAGKIMAYAYNELTEIPSDDQWKEDLQKVFLTGNKIQTIPDGTCLRCSQLSTLLLDRNANLNYISDEFFNDVPSLKTLDLSETGIKRLPKSVSNLKCLIALLLCGCGELSYIPSLRKLTRLITLDLSFTAITEEPMGLDSLVNLRCLNLLGTDKLVMSAWLIFKLVNLECLKLDVDEQLGIPSLEKLEVLVAYFRDISVFNIFSSFVAKHRPLRSYHLTLWKANNVCYDKGINRAYYMKMMNLWSASNVSYDMGINRAYSMKRITFEGMDLDNRELVLPGDIEELFVKHCQTGTRNLCSVLTSYGHDKYYRIELLDIFSIENVEYLCCLSPSCPFCSSTQLVGSLSLSHLKELEYLVSPDAHPLHQSIILFSHLTELSICGCHSMETLMTPTLLPQLQNLRTISVESCDKMKEIVGDDHSEMELPNLTSLELHSMPELNSVYRGVLLCPCLQTFSANWCKRLNPPPLIQISRGRALKMEKTSEYGYRWEN